MAETKDIIRLSAESIMREVTEMLSEDLKSSDKACVRVMLSGWELRVGSSERSFPYGNFLPLERGAYSDTINCVLQLALQKNIRVDLDLSKEDVFVLVLSVKKS